MVQHGGMAWWFFCQPPYATCEGSLWPQWRVYMAEFWPSAIKNSAVVSDKCPTSIQILFSHVLALFSPSILGPKS